MNIDEVYKLPKNAIIEQYFHPPTWSGNNEGSWFWLKIDDDKVLSLDICIEFFKDSENSEYYIDDLTRDDVDFIYHGIREGW